jgi:hypothetical protein
VSTMASGGLVEGGQQSCKPHASGTPTMACTEENDHPESRQWGVHLRRGLSCH